MDFALSVIRRSVSIAASFSSLKEIEIYRPGFLDPSNRVSGAIYFGTIPDLWAIGNLKQSATLQLFAQIESNPVAISSPASLQPGEIAFSFMTSNLPRQRNFPFLKVSSETRLIARLNRSLAPEESLSISGFADEEAKPVRSWDSGIEKALAAEMVKEWVRAQIENLSLDRPYLIGQPVPVFDKTLGDDPIVSSEGWWWLQGHKFAGTIGKPGSPADLADNRLKQLFLKQGKTEAQWDALETSNLPDISGRCLIGAGRGDGLSDRQLWEAGGEESHAPTEAETAYHGHGDGNHGHAVNAHRTDNLHGIGAGNLPHILLADNMGPSNIGAYHSGPIIGLAGGNQPFNVMQPYLAVPVLIFLGVLAP